MDRQQFSVFALTVLASFWGLKTCQTPSGGQHGDQRGHSSDTALVLSDTAHAGMPEADVELISDSQAACSSDSNITHVGEQVTLTGTVGRNHKLVDGKGRTFEMLDTGEGYKVKSLVGREVEIAAIVMELDARKAVVEVHEYKILK